jgi:hypothetical protein
MVVLCGKGKKEKEIDRLLHGIKKTNDAALTELCFGEVPQR